MFHYNYFLLNCKFNIFSINMNNASIVIIGNEILSGRTLDINANFIAKRCNDIGIIVSEIRTIPDLEKVIIRVIINSSKKYKHVFVTGGIGPTHDDITAQSVAAAFKRKLIINKAAKDLLVNYYSKRKEDLNESRIKMALIPARAKLILNPVSAAPGFRVKNVWVMAGVPKIMQSMFINYVEPNLKKGSKIYSKDINIFKPEGDIAKFLSKLQSSMPDVEIGSYPFIKNGKAGTNVVLKATKLKLLNSIYEKLVVLKKKN